MHCHFTVQFFIIIACGKQLPGKSANVIVKAGSKTVEQEAGGKILAFVIEEYPRWIAAMYVCRGARILYHYKCLPST